ncbi:putative ATP binding protein [Corchorus olitorius]|uniref:ATP binding protein n=1 Tax=Corchorus olitorius TaxID=93759 RepID=A0A1R3GUB3_9ROSI|nr:putative ATP binding protein [Corchorus olitorius]
MLLTSFLLASLLLISLLPSAGRLVANELATNELLVCIITKWESAHQTIGDTLEPWNLFRANRDKHFDDWNDDMGLLTFAVKEILGGIITEQLIKSLGIHLNRGISLEQVVPKTLVPNPKWSGNVK